MMNLKFRDYHMQGMLPQKTEEQRLAREKMIVGHVFAYFYVEMLEYNITMYKGV